ncbi:hypothetical protein LIPSTDRAFT_145934 [Lipomyces starkeyi NRRL Y-11557]|uniref:Uncharacterized protein n=1 Tax=Lipomyces starkeyi NRRL Y-11557 TaxID=675824 RepID=A0A1E3Q1L1_LIPST|nr:hypothetical protein LIPSTDRAFT_145934 [Lipomyces starkeyi NRRL Y-11557]
MRHPNIRIRIYSQFELRIYSSFVCTSTQQTKLDSTGPDRHMFNLDVQELVIVSFVYCWESGAAPSRPHLSMINLFACALSPQRFGSRSPRQMLVRSATPMQECIYPERGYLPRVIIPVSLLQSSWILITHQISRQAIPTCRIIFVCVAHCMVLNCNRHYPLMRRFNPNRACLIFRG